MPRRYRRRHRYSIARPLKTTKYSNETFLASINIGSDTPAAGEGTFYQVNLNCLPNNLQGVLGTRKVKNFTIRIKPDNRVFTPSGADPVIQTPTLFFVLAFVPEGNEPGPIRIGNGSMLSAYEPNQNVIMSGMVDDSQAYSFKSRLARNLNAGDQIGILLKDTTFVAAGDKAMTHLSISINYAVAF